MRVYVDSSALVKRYLSEAGSALVRSTMGESTAWLASRLVYVETMRAIGLSRGPGSPEVRRLSSEWSSFDVIELEHELAERAVSLAIDHGLRSLDAIHLAAALTPETGDLIMATYDDRLWEAARTSGLEVLPEVRPRTTLGRTGG